MQQVVTPVLVEGLVLRRSGRLVIDNATLEASSGVTALLGPNGAGKTSLLGAITGQLGVDAGTISWEGQRVDGRRSPDFLATLGWLPQTLTFPRRMRVHEVLDYAVWLKRTGRQGRQPAVQEALTTGGLEGLRNRRVGELSGGEQRRVGLAAATVCNPQVVLLDEPTVGLDPLQREVFHRRIRDAAAGRVVILATHLLEDVAATASHVTVIHHGRVLFTGTVHDFCHGADVTVDGLRDALGRLLSGPNAA